MAIIIDLRDGMPTGPGPFTNYVSKCGVDGCRAIFKLEVPIFQFKSSDFDAWIADVVAHRTECKKRLASGLNEAGKHFLGLA